MFSNHRPIYVLCKICVCVLVTIDVAEGVFFDELANEKFLKFRLLTFSATAPLSFI